MYKKQLPLAERLSLVSLEEPVEQEIITTAIEQLSSGQKENFVLGAMKDKFRKLALNQNISQKGLNFYTELQKPNIKVDTALSSSTWFH
ncbi:hypothetical protein LFYK43_00160 [Ligilactobacillus salitolerans]|uniref:Uncharacterized protein n=1 Tax=Ligilactobacillus salitolerans TaxID=1808352 RepID=A0A401IPU3_9LACO|nr:hypothetical protein [Ligilactobacillus salitolerans]GBG93557.1 hypothetical protein LFYK43_00160 [Ligilactobacillus salitolerans]